MILVEKVSAGVNVRNALACVTALPALAAAVAETV
jgi:hypothetical protein